MGIRKFHGRYLIKTVSWRVVASLTTMTIVFAFTRELTLSLGVGAVEVITKMILFYLHELGWERIKWGKPKHPLGDLPVTRELSAEDMRVIKEKLEDLGYL